MGVDRNNYKVDNMWCKILLALTHLTNLEIAIRIAIRIHNQVITIFLS